ncbi:MULTISPECIES: hypothetical protein, partial [unclassified Pasteurella]|uniref:GA-like domain-containing protein n=1 Tax=unclassified Pasteurella TaxID=2621516 RepID=UPI0019E5B32F|nr:peptidase [Pasteurella sp. 19428wF3_WM03]
EDVVKAAEDAEKAAEKALEDAKADGVITPEEKKAVEDANAAVEKAKDDAQKAIDNLPDSTGKDALQDRLDDVNTVEVPDVTDANGNGIPDDQEKALEDVVKAAEDAEKAAEKALEDAKSDGVIT